MLIFSATTNIGFSALVVAEDMPDAVDLIWDELINQGLNPYTPSLHVVSISLDKPLIYVMGLPQSEEASED